MKTLALLAITVLGLAACQKQASPKTATKAPASTQKPATTLAAEAVDQRFGAGFITHDTVEDTTATGTAVCGYVSPTKDPHMGDPFVFANGKLVTANDMRGDAFSSLVEHRCPDFVLGLPPVALSAEAT